MKSLLCWLDIHRTSSGELSYNLATKKIHLHCKSCQKIIRSVEHETQLTDKQYYWFKKIFEDEGRLID